MGRGWPRASVQESPFLASLGWAGLTSPDSRVFKWGGEKKAGSPETNGIVGVDLRDLRNTSVFCVRGEKTEKRGTPHFPCHVVSTPALSVQLGRA